MRIFWELLLIADAVAFGATWDWIFVVSALLIIVGLAYNSDGDNA